jgi:hypothetical protein
MLTSAFLRAHALRCAGVAGRIKDVSVKGELINMAADFRRWADELDGIAEPPRRNGGP